MSNGKVQLFVLYFIGLTLFFFFKTDAVAAWMKTADILPAFAVHMLSNPAYILLLAGVVWWRRQAIIRAFLAGLSLVLALDIISMPRLSQVAFDGSLTEFTLVDAVVGQAALNAGLTYPTFYALYYVVLPFSLMLLAVYLLGVRGFWNKIEGMAKS